MPVTVTCASIVFHGDTIFLLRDSQKPKDSTKPHLWRLPEDELRNNEDMLLCMRRTVLEQTGYKANRPMLFRVVHVPSRGGHNPTIRFIFGSEIYPDQIHQPNNDLKPVSPDELLQFADQGLFTDNLLIRLVQDFKAGLPPRQQNII